VQRQQKHHLVVAAAGGSGSSNGGGTEGRWPALRPLLAGLAGVAAAASLLLGTPIDVAQARTALTADERNTIQLFQRSRSSVVYITSLTTRWVAGWVGG
jgi:hypothetical protein